MASPDALKAARYEPSKKEKPAEESAPFWMLTMGDMNTLLMTFFIILFSLAVQERNKYLRLSEDVQNTSLTEDRPQEGVLDAMPNDSKVFSGWEPGPTSAPAKSETVKVSGEIECRISTTPQGTVITVGGEFYAFEEGDWRLLVEHNSILIEFLKWMHKQKHRILIRAFTAGNFEDSVVREGERVRKFEEKDWDAPDASEVSDHWLLASLRAREVRRALVEGREGRSVVSERIQVQIEAYNERLAENYVAEDRRKNRRVEIVILPYK